MGHSLSCLSPIIERRPFPQVCVGLKIADVLDRLFGQATRIASPEPVLVSMTITKYNSIFGELTDTELDTLYRRALEGAYPKGNQRTIWAMPDGGQTTGERPLKGLA